jgi:pyrroloquinoline quinone biosynthesis protein D
MGHCPSRRGDIYERSLTDEAVLYNPVDSVMHTLNPVAAFIWKLCDGEHTAEDIAQQVCERYDADPDAVVKDVQDTIDQLREKNLLQA